MIIENIISIEIELIEFEERYPSFNVSMSAEIYSSVRSSAIFNFKSLWFESVEWKKFIRQINSNTDGIESTLTDISSEMKLCFKPFKDGFHILFEVLQKSTYGSVSFKYERELSIDEFYILRNGFNGILIP